MATQLSNNKAIADVQESLQARIADLDIEIPEVAPMRLARTG